MALKREDVIGKKRPIPVKAITVPEWGEVFVRKMSAAERVLCEYMQRENDGKPLNYQARLAAMWVSDADGNRVFKDGDADAIGSEPAYADAIAEVVQAGIDFNSMASGAHDEAKKNSETIPSE